MRVLRRTRVPRATAPPGYGSKDRRKNEIEHYTPAVPSGGQPIEGQDADEMWTEWQKNLHAAICDALLEDPDPQEVAALL